MKNRHPIARRVRSALWPAAALLTTGLFGAACQERPICPNEPKLTAYVHDRLGSSVPDKVDVLLAVDNSQSMADKQALLALAVPDLVGGLVNPPCIDDKGVPVEPGPKSPLEACPKGSERPFSPVLDIHIGVISSSLGSHGADTCPTKSNPSNDDRGHLISRVDPAGAAKLPTYQGQGFLAWDPSQKLNPPGEADLDQDTSADANDTALLPVLADMIIGVGQEGCGFEAQLESWYRFLVDPTPYQSLSLDENGRVKLEGTDLTLLEQRKNFLRPDSLLAIVLLTDENDCSVRETGDYYVALRGKTNNGNAYHLPAARSECADDPNDPCCFSCSQKSPKNSDGSDLCAPDPTCKDADGNTRTLTDAEDPLNLRCWDQKRRFGIDFLYPIDRYTTGLTSPTLTDRNGETVPNPIFADLDPSDANTDIRDPSMVILTGIVGVPWQDLARDPKDLKKGFKSAEELATKDASGKTTWDVVLGDPSKNVAPGDPLMIESVAQRKGKNPITGDPLVTSATPLQNPINGHDFNPKPQLQYACIFPLPEPITCTVDNCNDPSDSPVFDPPYDQPHATQPRAGAVPGTRFLGLLKSLGNQGVAASVCPAQTTDKDALDFGYRPAIAAALARLQVGLTNSCLPRKLIADDAGQVNCIVVEASRREGKEMCCDPSKARVEPDKDHQGAVDEIVADALVKGRGYDCFCEIPQLTGTKEGEPLYTCQNDTSKSPALPNGDPVDGYCYIDQSADPPIGNPALVSSCPETERRTIRFVGQGNPTPESTLFVACSVTDDSAHKTCDENGEQVTPR